MGFWNLRKVKVKGRSRIYEVYYDDKNRPYSLADAVLIDKLRFWKYWLKTLF